MTPSARERRPCPGHGPGSPTSGRQQTLGWRPGCLQSPGRQCRGVGCSQGCRGRPKGTAGTVRTASASFIHCALAKWKRKPGFLTFHQRMEIWIFR